MSLFGLSHADGHEIIRAFEERDRLLSTLTSTVSILTRHAENRQVDVERLENQIRALHTRLDNANIPR